MVFAVSIGLFNPSTLSFSFSLKSILGVIGSLLVIISAARSQIVMYKQDKKGMRNYLLMFIGAWVLIAYALALPAAVWKPDLIKFGIAFLGAFGVVAGMIFQMIYRKRGFDYIKTGTPSPGNVYSPGLPLFTGGWLLLAFANALV